MDIIGAKEVNKITLEARTENHEEQQYLRDKQKPLKRLQWILRSSTQRRGDVGKKRNGKIKWEQYQEKDHQRMWLLVANNTGGNRRRGQWLWLKLFLTVAR